MIVKERTIPLIIQKEEALLRRLAPSHQKREEIAENLKKRWAGFRGEQKADFYLRSLSGGDYLIFQDLRLTYRGNAFQIDTLLLTPRYILIAECKNISGPLFYDQYSNRLIRSREQKEEGFPDPLAQVRHQQYHLQEWMKLHQLKPCPIESLVVIGSENAILKTNPGKNQIFQKIIYAEHILDKIKELNHFYPKKCLSPYRVQKMSQLLVNSHTPLHIDILKRYAIKASDIIPGVQCPACRTIPMKRKHAAWYCTRCGRASKEAHQQAILDYLLLHSAITNRKCREFLQINSIDLTRRLLESMGLLSTGRGKGKWYFLPF